MRRVRSGGGWTQDARLWPIMGTETEFGISCPEFPRRTPWLHRARSSTRTPRRPPPAAGPVGLRGGEPAARPARLRSHPDLADPSLLTDEEVGLANVILTNGARLYVDHAHPEYSTPEVTNPRDAVLWDKAGELITRRAGELASAMPGASRLLLYKNNTDNKGASYGSHENYLMSRATPFNESCATWCRSSCPVRWCAGPDGWASGRTARAQVPDLAARRLHRGRGRSGDHLEAADREHP